MKSVIFDTSTIISIATNNLLWVIKELKNRFKGKFYISPMVKEEIITKPLKSRMFKLEAMQILSLVADGIIEIYESEEVKRKADYLSSIVNNVFSVKGKGINLIHKGELESLALVQYLNGVYAIDERTTRVLIENPLKLANLLSSKTHTKLDIDKVKLKILEKEFKDIKIIRSTELIVTAYDLGLLNIYLNPKEREIENINPKKNLLDGLLWGLRLRGCAISTEEINEILSIKGF